MEVQELRARLDQNSGNSSRPPSSDVIKPKRKRSTGLPKASKLKGGQKGHKGGTLKMVEQADEVKQLRPSRCACGQRLLRHWRTYKTICQAAFQEEPPAIKSKKGRPKKSKGRNLAERLFKYQAEVLRFALEEEVPFSNNQAERDLRPVKGKQKVAGCFRTQTGAKRYARLQGVFSTWRKQGYSVFRSLKMVLDGQPFSFG